MSEIMRRPWHVAFHYLGCAVAGPDGIQVPSLHAPMIEAIADAVDRLTLVAYDPPAVARDADELIDHTIGADHPNIDLVSLGPMGNWRDAPKRKRRIAPIVSDASSSWDVLIVWLQNRRIGAVTGANRCARLVAIDGACVGDEARTQRLPLRTKVLRRAIAIVTERIGRRVIRDADLVVVNSEMLAARHRTLNDNVTIHRWTRRRSDASHQVDDRPLTGPVDVLVAGRLTQYKGVFEALDAFVQIKQRILPDARLHIAGEGPAADELAARVGAAGIADSVTFHGWLGGEDLFALYRDTDLLLHLSYAESFPRVVLEALAHSVPVICTPVGGLRDTLDDGREVLFVPPYDVEPAVLAAQRLAGDVGLRRSLIAQGFEAARESALDEFVSRVVDDISATWPDLPDRTDASTR